MGFEGREAIILALYQHYLKTKPLICQGFRLIQQVLNMINLDTDDLARILLKRLSYDGSRTEWIKSYSIPIVYNFYE